MSKKYNELKPWLKESWVIPPEASAEFVYYMEDVIGVYTRPYNPMHPVVCFDESSKMSQIHDLRLWYWRSLPLEHRTSRLQAVGSVGWVTT